MSSSETRQPANKPLRSVRTDQALVSTVLALTLVATCVLVDGLSHNPSLLKWINEQRVSSWKRDNSYYQHTQTFWEMGSRILLDEIPSADFSKGGVVFVGSSALRASLMVWSLPQPLRGLVHNFGIGAATQIDQANLVRYLIDHEGLLAAGEKAMVVFGLFYGNAVDSYEWRFRDTFPDLVTQDGLYSYSRRQGLEPVPMPAWTRLLYREKVRSTHFLKVLKEYLVLREGRFALEPRYEARSGHNPKSHRGLWRGLMGKRWRQPMAREMESLASAIDAVQSHGARVTAVLMPLGSWQKGLPYPPLFRKMATKLCREKSVPLIDLTDLLPDDGFYDHAHPNYTGTAKIHAALVAIAREHLEKVGLLQDGAAGGD